MKKISLVAVILLFCSYSFAQSFYAEDSVQTIRITFAQSNWDELLDAEKATTENYIMATSVSINGIVYDSVGVKYKGNSTYRANQVKNPFHIELDTYKDHKHENYTDIKLSNVYNDPSFVREVLSYKILRNYMDAPLSNYANVYVNNTLIGLYSNSESISKKFVDDRFGSKKNTFIKGNPPAGAGPGTSDYPNLLYIGTDSNNYYAKYELKSDFGWDELIHLCDTLNNYTAAIESILDVDRTLWMHAFNNVFVNLDSYSGGFTQNYYLYRGSDGRFLPIVWDLNESFGSFTMTGTGNLNGTAAAQRMTHLLHENDAAFPLISKLLAVPTYKKMYLAHVKTMLQDNFTINGPYYAQGQALQATAAASVQADQNKFYTYANFTANLTTDVTSGGGGPGGPPSSKPGITNLMNGRYSYLMGISDFTTTEPTITAITVSDTTPAVGDTLIITANVVNENSVFLRYRTDIGGIAFDKVTMFDDGLHNDGAANDDIYGAEVIIDGGFVEYYIYAENNTIGKFSPTSAAHEYYSIFTQAKAAGDIVINEFMASNNSAVTDQNGEFDDWIEIYNNGTLPIALDNYRLTDDPLDFGLFSFPKGTTINPNEYIVVWADGDLTQSGFHADFKLSAGGETILLTDSNLLIIDSITYGSQVSDTSFGRLPNGTGSFVKMPQTIGSQNSLTPAVTSDIVINEFLASNGTTQTDQDGEFDDWIEIYNKGNSSVNISNYRLTDDANDLTVFTFPSGTILNANSYLIVWADGDTMQAGLHADFKISTGGENLYLTDSVLNFIDSIGFGNQTTDVSYGRFPNGTGTFQTMTPTYNAQNSIINNSSVDIVINEFLASNSTIADQDGEFDDWVELYNKGNKTVDLSTFSLSDDRSDLSLYTFPTGTMLQADSFIVVWADKDVAQVGYHADFKLSASGETIYLSKLSGIVDSVMFGTQVADSSFGRWPNGTGSFKIMVPTFRAQNSNNTGLNNASINSVDFVIYPNPAKESFTVKLKEFKGEITTIQIFNNMGQQLYLNTVNQSITVDVSTWAKGLYFVRLGSTTSRIVVQ